MDRELEGGEGRVGVWGRGTLKCEGEIGVK